MKNVKDHLCGPLTTLEWSSKLAAQPDTTLGTALDWRVIVCTYEEPRMFLYMAIAASFVQVIVASDVDGHGKVRRADQSR